MLTIGLIIYSITAIAVGRKCASAMFYDPLARDWESLIISIFMGAVAGALFGFWLPFYGIRKAFHDDASSFARVVVGEPKDIKEYRLLEQKVGIKRATQALEQELIDL